MYEQVNDSWQMIPERKIHFEYLQHEFSARSFEFY